MTAGVGQRLALFGRLAYGDARQGRAIRADLASQVAEGVRFLLYDLKALD